MAKQFDISLSWITASYIWHKKKQVRRVQTVVIGDTPEEIIEDKYGYNMRTVRRELDMQKGKRKERKIKFIKAEIIRKNGKTQWIK